ncbi:unnamed protein product [Rotaria sordida]|uniref:Uncharacterized protein n=1 Tax=Rotaria sordida TaxID=392033 RepID=A0A814PNM6_9BILA|nr:unnamed protein product [Rotaria sordida]
MSEARGAAAAVFRLIDEGNDPGINEADVWKDDTESIYNINGDIEFDNIDFIYPSRKEAPVLHNLSLIARAGQRTALVGSSGCGKSTCLSLLLRYYEPSSGRITIDGRSITDYNVKQLRENIGAVSQEPILFDMSIYENIRFGKLNATQEEIEQAAREANAHHFIMQLPDAFKYCSISERRHHIVLTSFLFLLLGVGLFILGFFQYTAFAISGSKLTQRIRSKAFACLLRQEVAYFDRPENSSGAICTRLSSHASAIQEMTGTRLGVICELAIEVLHNMRTIKQLSIEKEILRQYSELIHKLFISSWKPLLLSSMISSVFWTLDGFAIAFLYWRALILIEKNELTSNHIMTMFALIVFTIQALKVLGMTSIRVAASISAAEAFFDLFDRKPAIDNTSTEGQELVDFHGEIKFDQVKFIYPTRPTAIILDKFQLNIKPSQHVALVGRSGCGKSTIIQLLERFYDVTSGKILVDGIDIQKLNLQWIRSHFGLVSQEPVLFDLTIAENIAYGLENVSMEDIINAARRANIHQFIEQLPQGYETKVGLKGSFLSGGEKQRIAIARVLLRQLKVLLLDEATSAMDSHNEQIVQEALEQAQREDSSRTSLNVAHRLSTIRSCDLICVLERGHIVESGTYTELTQRRGAYYKMLARDNLQ